MNALIGTQETLKIMLLMQQFAHSNTSARTITCTVYIRMDHSIFYPPPPPLLTKFSDRVKGKVEIS